MIGPLQPFRIERASGPRAAGAASKPSAKADAPGPAGSTAPSASATDAASQAFDGMVETRAEIEREHDALEALAMAEIKNEDAIMKKWIALIG